jgi:hypothetical protein
MIYINGLYNSNLVDLKTLGLPKLEQVLSFIIICIHKKKCEKIIDNFKGSLTQSKLSYQELLNLSAATDKINIHKFMKSIPFFQIISSMIITKVRDGLEKYDIRKRLIEILEEFNEVLNSPLIL